MKVMFGWKTNAGLVCFAAGDWALHLLVQPEHWEWGYGVEEYDSCMDWWGIGPLVLLCRTPTGIAS